MLNVDRDNSKTTWNFDMRSKRVDSVNSGLKHIKKCQKGSRPPPMALISAPEKILEHQIVLA